MRLALDCARARVGDSWGQGLAQRVMNMTERMTCCCGVLRPCLPAPLGSMGSSQEAPSGSTGGAQLEAAGRHATNISYVSAPQWRACATVRSCSEKACEPEARQWERPRQLLPARNMPPCIEPLMSLTDTLEISGSSHYSAKVVWGMHAGRVNRLEYARGLVGATLRL